ncbi:hypothetical protein ACFV29_26360 [Streptomyces sp. NPDC059690]|uniref:hypothetical protein n=1 Tax=Streptomyces sp. NPDC059690 TaxID=3346907 RepID=UPI003693FC54
MSDIVGADRAVTGRHHDDEQQGDDGAPLHIGVPVLVIGAPPPPLTAPAVLTAGEGADLMARAATEHLLALGHVTVHHLAGPQRWYAARCTPSRTRRPTRWRRTARRST